jgi:type I restriction enzyme R subunit
LEKLRKAINVDWRIGLREIIEKILTNDSNFKTKDERLSEEFDKFDSRYMPGEADFDSAKTVFNAYIIDTDFRDIVDSGDFSQLNVSPYGEAFRALTPELRRDIVEYIKDFVPLNNFVN